jgi:hypothetical protein
MPESFNPRTAASLAIMRERPDVEAVEFDDTGEHVFLLTPDPDRGKAWVRYRLGPTSRRFVRGEFPNLPVGALLLDLLPPANERLYLDMLRPLLEAFVAVAPNVIAYEGLGIKVAEDEVRGYPDGSPETAAQVIADYLVEAFPEVDPQELGYVFEALGALVEDVGVRLQHPELYDD